MENQLKTEACSSCGHSSVCKFEEAYKKCYANIRTVVNEKEDYEPFGTILTCRYQISKSSASAIR